MSNSKKKTKLGKKKRNDDNVVPVKKDPSDVNFHVLERKWRIFFRFLDVDGSGCVSEDDFRLIADNLISVYGASGGKAMDIHHALKGWWRVFKLYSGGTRNIATEDEYVIAMKALSTKDYPVFVAQAKELSNGMFDAIDVNGDGVITRTEFIKLMSVMGARNLSYVGRVFDRLDADKSGVLDRGEFQKCIVSFNVSDLEKDSMSFVFNIPKEA